MQDSSPYEKQIKKDLTEITDENIIKELKKKLENHKFYIDTYNKDFAGLIFIRNFVTQIKQMTNTFMALLPNDLKKIIGTLSTSNIKVGNIVI